MEETPLYFPLFVSLQDRKCLIVGGGNIAFRRASTLSEFSCEILVIAPELSEGMKKLQKEGKVKVQLRKYEANDCREAFLVVAVINDRELNREIGREGKEAGAFVSVADAREECTFFFPGIAFDRDNKAVVGITASGQNHKLARGLTDVCRKILREFSGKK